MIPPDGARRAMAMDKLSDSCGMNETIVVSGLPRSGTSMMMQLLGAAGIPLLHDMERPADADNPNGYYELEKTRSLKTGSAFLSGSEGKAVKVISLLLYDLPPDRQYKVIFMLRDMAEILDSQSAMLIRTGKDDGLDRKHLADSYEVHLRHVRAWLQTQKNFKVFYCSYNGLLSRPDGIFAELNAFLGVGLDMRKAVSTIDPALYRQRASKL